MYDIHWKSKAMKQLAGIDSRETRDAIYASVQSLRSFPEVGRRMGKAKRAHHVCVRPKN